MSVLLGGGSVGTRGRLSFELDASLTIDGSSDSEISNKGLPTPHLMPALKDWKTRGAPTAGEGTMSTSGDTLEVSSSSDDELDDQGLPSAPDATQINPGYATCPPTAGVRLSLARRRGVVGFVGGVLLRVY